MNFQTMHLVATKVPTGFFRLRGVEEVESEAESAGSDSQTELYSPDLMG